MLTAVMWPNATGLLLTIYGTAHAIVFAALAIHAVTKPKPPQ